MSQVGDMLPINLLSDIDDAERVQSAPKITFFVPGKPETQGSSRAFRHRSTGRIIVTSDNKRLKPWRKAIAEEARNRMVTLGIDAHDGPVIVEADFILPRLKTHPKTAKGRTPEATCKPDLDKLQRALGDSLQTAGVIKEDSRIVEWRRTRKRYAEIGEAAGARITVILL